MAGARGDALEWALALAAAPGERHALRQRPLPDGVDALLQIAGGSDGPALAGAMQRTGLAPAELVEAARFYLREVLFFPEADAYRVLGLSADASDEQVKHHHRLLQQWLHPDRPASDWDAAFAARVNAAWSQLRTAERREAYASQAAPAFDPVVEQGWSPPARLQPAHFEAGDEDHAGRWRRRAPVLALFGLCAFLGVLAVRDMQREPEDAIAGASVEDDGAAEALVALQLPAAGAPAPPPTAAAKPAVAPSDKSSPHAVPKPEPASNPLKRVIAALIKPAETAAPREVAASKPSAAVAARTSVTAPVPVAGPPAHRQANKLPDAMQPAVAAATAIAREAPAPHELGSPGAAKMHVDEPVPAVVVPQPTAPKPVRVATVAPAPPEPRANAASAKQAVQAQATGQRLLTYVSGGRGGVPPIWANLAAQGQAGRVREALQGVGRVRVGQPEWRIGDDTASMRTNLSPSDGQSRSLRVDLVWREQRWLVSQLDLGS